MSTPTGQCLQNCPYAQGDHDTSHVAQILDKIETIIIKLIESVDNVLCVISSLLQDLKHLLLQFSPF